MHVAFDMDGVLLDSTSGGDWYRRALDRTLRDVDREPTPDRRTLLGPSNLRDFESVAAELDVPAERLWTIRHDNYVREKAAAIEDGRIEPFDDLVELHLIADLAPISIVSNSPASIVDTFVETADLGSIVETSIGRGDDLEALDRMKPAQDFYDRLVERTNGEEYVYVGDSRTDALFAQRTGMDFLHLDREAGEVRTLADVRERIIAKR